MKTLIVVSGGDAPGINAAIAAFAELAERGGDHVLGAQVGFAGLLDGQAQSVDIELARLLAGRGGSILRSSREPVLGADDARDRLLTILAQRQIDNLLLLGGDGTIRFIMPLLASWGLASIILPTTIDNDVPGADSTLGHDSACNFAIQSIDGIRATAHALPGRIFIVETLGGDCGNLALAIAYAGGADAVLLPEYDFPVDRLAERLRATVERKGSALAVVGEGVADINRLIEQLPHLTGTRVRHSRLGHAQRGADVSHHDRCLAQDMSRLAYAALKTGVQIGAVVADRGDLRVHAGLLLDAKAPAPDYERFAWINGL